MGNCKDCKDCSCGDKPLPTRNQWIPRSRTPDLLAAPGKKEPQGPIALDEACPHYEYGTIPAYQCYRCLVLWVERRQYEGTLDQLQADTEWLQQLGYRLAAERLARATREVLKL